MSLEGKTILITGSARRVGKAMALAVARAGGEVIIHTAHSIEAAKAVQKDIQDMGRRAFVVEADFADPGQADDLIGRAWQFSPLFALVNNAAIFESLRWDEVDLASWQKHLDINLTSPFLLSQAFARRAGPGRDGRIVNILDWRALRPGADHLPYTISKAALAAVTKSLAQALAPQITVNGLAFGAILPPSNGTVNPRLLDDYPAGRWATLDEVGQALLFLLDGPGNITGEIIHLDGGRHLV
jgi:pteridine reductase